MKITKTEQKYILQELIELDNKGLLSNSYYLINLLRILIIEKQPKRKTHCSHCSMSYDNGSYLCVKCGRIATSKDL